MDVSCLFDVEFGKFDCVPRGSSIATTGGNIQEHVCDSPTVCGVLCAPVLRGSRVSTQRSSRVVEVTLRGHLLAHNVSRRRQNEQTRSHITSCMRAQIGVESNDVQRTCGGLKRFVACQTNMVDTCANGRWRGSLLELVEAFQAVTCLKFVPSRKVAAPPKGRHRAGRLRDIQQILGRYHFLFRRLRALRDRLCFRDTEVIAALKIITEQRKFYDNPGQR